MLTPLELKNNLEKLVANESKLSVMIWGAPGIGKSAIIQQIADQQNIQLIDIRLSQLSPLDFRGIPVADNGSTVWLSPHFLPKEGRGILLLDEINMAPPVMQGLAQQLVLDRKVASYQLPDGWFVWAAGNRKEDLASVFNMSAPLANRLIHFEAKPCINEFKRYAYGKQIHEHIISFLSFRPSLLHKLCKTSNEWPSPRTWETASALLEMEIDPSHAIGPEVANELKAHIKLAHTLPNIKEILQGKAKFPFPSNPSVAFATISAICLRHKNEKELINAFVWVKDNASMEWVQAFMQDAFAQVKDKSYYKKFINSVSKNEELINLMHEYHELIYG